MGGIHPVSCCLADPMISVCAIIPCYNHAATIADTVRSLSEFVQRIIIIDDGSEAHARRTLELLVTQYSDLIYLHRIEQNCGKGCAVKEGIHLASKHGYSHALQIDADGQHDVTSIPILIEHARTFPHSLVTGVPHYDETINIGRFIGRYITHVWVWIETLSLDIRDSMCGFRVYPVAETIEIIDSIATGDRMDFDTEIMVRMYWQGVDIKNVPVNVKYHKDGLSHFRMVRDNILISRMHARLFFGMLLRIPKLLYRKFGRTDGQQHWSRQKEKGTYLGLKFLFLVYRMFGRAVFTLLLHPVVFFFYIFSADKRSASKDYLQHINRKTNTNVPVHWYHSYAHFISFGYCILDKLAAWLSDDLPVASFTGEKYFRELEVNQQGAVFIGSHLGNLEYCRALSRGATSKKINAVVYLENAENFTRMLKEVNPAVDINLVHVSSFGVDTAIYFREKIAQGEILVIVGDRTSPYADERNIEADFLGDRASFPQGPFILACLMDCPVYLLFCIKEQDGYNIYLEPFRDRLTLPRKERQRALSELVQEYAGRLETYCLKAPLQWFNFFDFWARKDH